VIKKRKEFQREWTPRLAERKEEPTSRGRKKWGKKARNVTLGNTQQKKTNDGNKKYKNEWRRGSRGKRNLRKRAT